jgi:hypothetical protein
MVVPVTRRYQLLMVTVLAREARAQRLEHRDLVAAVGAARDTLRGVHPNIERLAALFANVDVSQASSPLLNPLVLVSNQWPGLS